MNDDFAPFELAVKLKEKGYPQVKENTLAMYDGYGEWFSLTKNLDAFEYSFEDFDDRDCVCPTISQVLKWLRKEKKIYIEIFLYNGKYSCFVKSVTQICEEGFFHECLNDNTTDEEYDTYEQAALAGIEYVLDNLI